MKHSYIIIDRKGQFTPREFHFVCACGDQGPWRHTRLKAEGLGDVHLREEDEKEKKRNPEVQRVQELRRSAAAGPVRRDVPRSTEKKALRLEWFE